MLFLATSFFRLNDNLVNMLNMFMLQPTEYFFIQMFKESLRILEKP